MSTKSNNNYLIIIIEDKINKAVEFFNLIFHSVIK